jgi:hypothetical protein
MGSATQPQLGSAKGRPHPAQPQRSGPESHPGGGPPPKPSGKKWLPPGLACIASLVLSAAIALAESASGNPNVAFVSEASKSHPPSTIDARLTLRVYNYAHIDQASLDLSEWVAAESFQSVGIETVWVDCPVSKSEAWTYRACESAMGTTDLVVRILPQHMAAKLHVIAEVLGSAQQCSENEPACELNVFYHHVDQLATKGYRGDRILGYAIAHEVAHVLIGPGHSDEGIMRGEWTHDDLQRISWGMHLGFTNQQSKRLREAVLRRKTSMPQERSARANLTGSERK